MEKSLKPWEQNTMTEEQQMINFREMGKFYKIRNQLDIAHHYFSKALGIRDDDPTSLLVRSQCKILIADALNALTDVESAQKLLNRQPLVELHVSKCKYDMNRFEDAIMDMYNYKRHYKGAKKDMFENRIHVIEKNFIDNVGESLGYFFLENRKILHKSLKEYEEKTTVDPRPLWKILKEEGNCDVISLIEKKKLLLHPRELARRRLTYKLFNQTYFKRSWSDVIFLKSLLKNKKLYLKQTHQTSQYLRAKVTEKFGITNKFLEMLYTRSPLYSERVRRFPNRARAHKYREDFLYRIQYHTMRHINFILKKIKELRSEKRLIKLCQYVEDEMGNFFVLKTHRVMPWKFEFVNEVYNTVALAYADTLKIPNNLDTYPPFMQIYILLNIRSHSDKEEIPTFIFGRRETYQEAGVTDFKYIKYKKYQTRLEKRLLFVDYKIERAYLLHEISVRHLKQTKYDEAATVARKLIEESRKFNGYIWMFLGSIILCKLNAAQGKIEKFQESITISKRFVKNLKSKDLMYFVMTMDRLNKLSLDFKINDLSNSQTQSQKKSINSR